jgi:hypothetical protein
MEVIKLFFNICKEATSLLDHGSKES